MLFCVWVEGSNWVLIWGRPIIIIVTYPGLWWKSSLFLQIVPPLIAAMLPLSLRYSRVIWFKRIWLIYMFNRLVVLLNLFLDWERPFFNRLLWWQLRGSTWCQDLVAKIQGVRDISVAFNPWFAELPILSGNFVVPSISEITYELLAARLWSLIS